MFDLDTWQEIHETVRRNKLRTFLTACGVFWGMFMLLLMSGFGGGLERGVQRNMSDFATNAVYIWGQRTSMPFAGRQPGRWVVFHNADVDAIAEEVDGIETLAPRLQRGGYQNGSNVHRAGKTGNFQVMGDVPAYNRIQIMRMEAGRFINPIDMEGRRKVAVIGAQVARELFDPADDPIGGHIEIDGVWFQVIGVFHSPRVDDDGDRQNATIHIPFTTFQQAFNAPDRVGWLAITALPDRSGAEVEEAVRAVLATQHGIHPEDTMAIGSYNAEEGFRKMTTLFAGIRFFVWFVGGMTLLAGAFGVSNIMLIAVKERTKEIGVRRALGATPMSIVSMVMQESLVLTLVAGYGGLVLGVALLEAISAAVGTEHEVLGSPQVDFGLALGAGVVLVLVGALAGLIPARHAARIHPVEALRAE
ncbi:MAG: ABC transporter permease [Alphaproteobacteria bacterium]|nr:ABC transporter permease [Alphaproteobacteria bacterium]